MGSLERSGANENSELDAQTCAFCGGFAQKIGSATAEFLQVYPGLSENGQVIKVSENFILMADVAPITNDHLLLTTKEHVSSMARIENDNQVELETFLVETIERMQSFHPEKEIVVFEHGVGTINGKKIQCGSCGRTDHAHFHILPVAQEEDPVAQILSKTISSTFNTEFEKLAPLLLLDLKGKVEGFPYLYIWSNKSKNACCMVQKSVEINIPSQLIRKLLMEQNTSEKDYRIWDWRDFVIFYPKMGQKMIAETMKRWLNK